MCDFEVRLFDSISRSGGMARYANIDHCVSLVVQLMMQVGLLDIMYIIKKEAYSIYIFSLYHTYVCI